MIIITNRQHKCIQWKMKISFSPYPILWRLICIHFVFYAYAIYINYTCN